MDDVNEPTDEILRAMANRAAYTWFYRNRADFGWELIHQAMEVVLCTIYAPSDGDLRDGFSELREAIKAELSEERPNIELVRLQTAAWHCYFRAVRSKPVMGDLDLKQAILEQLEQDLLDHLNVRDLFIFAIMRELDGCEIIDNLPSLRDYLPYWTHVDSLLEDDGSANEPY